MVGERKREEIARRYGELALCAPPLPPVWIPRTHPLRIGRAPDADLVIPSSRVSREHARVGYVSDGSVVVEDLSSRNGTRINGKRLRDRVGIEPRDEIGIGDEILTLCRLDERLRSRAPEETSLSLDPVPEGRVARLLRGNLAYVPVGVLLRVLEGESFTGRLEIGTPVGPARLWLDGGRPVHAESPDRSGVGAASEILDLDRGECLFAEGAVAPRRTLAGSATELVLGHARE